MGVVQKSPTLTLFFGPQKTSFFRLFSTFSGFSQKRNRPTDATFDKNRKKTRKPKNDKKTTKIKNVPFKEMKTTRQKTTLFRGKVHKKSIKSKIGQKTSKIVKKPEK